MRPTTFAAISVIALTWFPTPSSAFCGFYVSDGADELTSDASVVVLMRAGDRTIVTMRNDYRGPPEDFALVVPVPETLTRDHVRTLRADAFDRIERLSAPRLVEYWERDPCWRPRARPRGERQRRRRGRMSGGGSGGQPGGVGTRWRPPPVTVEARFAVDEYDVVILDASDSNGLEGWLHANGYTIPAGAADALRPYVEADYRFFVARVDVSRLRFNDGQAVLSPLRFHYRSKRLELPVRLGRLNARGAQDLVVLVLSPTHRFEVANRENVVMPTNLVLRERARGAFASVYRAMVDRVMARHPNSVITEYAWNAGNCDPCPTQPLAQSGLQVFGADVIAQERVTTPPTPYGWTLTRLHTRIDDRDTTDLVFRPAGALNGGHGSPFRSGALPIRVTERDRGRSAFQSRYAVLHRWNRPVHCEAPRRGRWGGPPGRAAPPPRSMLGSRALGSRAFGSRALGSRTPETGPIRLRRFLRTWGGLR